MRSSADQFHPRHRSLGVTIKSMLVTSGLLLGMPASVDNTRAAFSLNWARDYSSEGASFINNDAYVVCNMSYLSSANCGGGFGGDTDLNGSHDDGTAFLQEQLTLSGERYFHVIVGDHTQDDMAMEVFIKSNASNPIYSDSIRGSDSVGSTSSSANREYNMTNPYSSDSSKNGNGSGNPNSVIMRQVVSDGEISMEFLKDSFTQKPLITQTLTTAEMTQTVTMDMRSRNYSQITPIGLGDYTNTTVLLGADRYGTEGDYDADAQAQAVTLSAGGFTYTPGSGYGGSGGTYTWWASYDNFQPMNRNYNSYCNPTQNPSWGSGPCAGGGGGGGGWGW